MHSGKRKPFQPSAWLAKTNIDRGSANKAAVRQGLRTQKNISGLRGTAGCVITHWHLTLESNLTLFLCPLNNRSSAPPISNILEIFKT